MDGLNVSMNSKVVKNGLSLGWKKYINVNLCEMSAENEIYLID